MRHGSRGTMPRPILGREQFQARAFRDGRAFQFFPPWIEEPLTRLLSESAADEETGGRATVEIRRLTQFQLGLGSGPRLVGELPIGDADGAIEAGQERTF